MNHKQGDLRAARLLTFGSAQESKSNVSEKERERAQAPGGRCMSILMERSKGWKRQKTQRRIASQFGNC